MSASSSVKSLVATDFDRPSVDELVDRARAMIPALRKRGAEADALRRLPEDTLADIIAAGFHLIGTPREFGGMGYGQDVISRVAVEVAKGDGPSGWLACFYAIHNMMVGMFPLQAQEEVWGNGGLVLTSTISTGGLLTYEAAEGGQMVSGHVRFSSGIDASNWLIIIGPRGLFLIPKSDYEIDDDWHVMGMKGSGSKGVRIANAFVPNHRIVEASTLGACENYGAKHYEAIHYGLPFESWTRTSQTSAILGMALGLLDLYDERIRGRTDPHTGQPAIERPGWQLRFAESAAELEAAKALFEAVHADFYKWHEAGGKVSDVEMARVRRNIVFVTKLSLAAVNRLFDGGDASTIYEFNPVQRFYRDIHTASMSISQVWDEPAMQFSRAHWGLEPQARR